MPENTETPDFMEEARAFAAQCWCDEETSGIEMDPRLAEAVARRIAGWMDTAARHAGNEEFYRGLLDECAVHLGPEVYVADDGTVMEDPLRLKVPGLVGTVANLPQAVVDTGHNDECLFCGFKDRLAVKAGATVKDA